MIKVVLAGGKATRLPNKLLLQTRGGKAVVSSSMEYMKGEISRTVVLIGAGDEALQGYLRMHYPSAECMFDGGEGLMNALRTVQGKYPDEALLVLCGDNVYPDGEQVHLPPEGVVSVVVRVVTDNDKRRELDLYSRGLFYRRGSVKSITALSTPWVVSSKAVIGEHESVLEWLNLTYALATFMSDDGWFDLGTKVVYDGYMAGGILKKESSSELVDRQLAFLHRISSVSDVHRVDGTSYTYTIAPCKLHGVVQPVVDAIYRFAEDMWSRPPLSTDEFSAEQYVAYVLSVCPESWVRPLLPYLMELTEHRDYVPCLVHGDFTVENCLVDGLTIRPIDAGLPRGMNCRELDEAKLMQSVILGWENFKRGWVWDDVKLPFEPTRLHWLLLLTHLIRLYAHVDKHPDGTRMFVERCVQEVFVRLTGTHLTITEV